MRHPAGAPKVASARCQAQERLRRPVAGTRLPQRRDDLPQLRANGGAAQFVPQQLAGRLAQALRRGGVLDELGKHGGIRQQVGHRRVRHRDQAPGDLVRGPGRAVERDRRHAMQRALERHRAGRGQRHRRAGKRLAQPAHHQRDPGRRAGAELLRRAPQRLAGQHHLKAQGRSLLQPPHGLEQERHMRAQLAKTASGEQHHGRLAGRVGQPRARARSRTRAVAVDERMPHPLDAQPRHPLGVPVLLEREEAQQEIEIAGQAIGPARPRGPDLGRDVLHEPGAPVAEHPVPGRQPVADRADQAPVEA